MGYLLPVEILGNDFVNMVFKIAYSEVHGAIFRPSDANYEKHFPRLAEWAGSINRDEIDNGKLYLAHIL